MSIFTDQPLSQVTYTNYFKGLAANHKEIAHVDNTHEAFVELLDSSGPYNFLDIQEFEDKISQLESTFMALQSFRGRFDDRQNASPEYMVFGAFLIMKKIEQTSFNMRSIRNPALDACHRIGEGILGWMKKEAESIGVPMGCVFELKGELENVVIPTHSVVGKRISFQYIQGAEDIAYNEDDWITPMEE